MFAKSQRGSMCSTGQMSSGRCAWCRGLWLALLAALVPVVVLAAVTITGFVVDAGEQEILVDWETASELGNLGFYVLRSETEATGYVRLPLDASPSEQVIPSLDDFGIGAFYEYIDVQVTPGIRYYYKVQDIPANGSAGEIAGPESAMIPLATNAAPSTATATTAPATTAAPTSTPTPSPTTTPTTKPTTAPAVNFWADVETVKAGDCTWLQWQVDHVQAVFLDGSAVNGQGAQTVCPCEAETHVLHVDYSDGSSEDFPLQIAVTGSCGSGTTSSILATPTRRPTPKLTPTVAPATPTPQPPAVTPTARPTPTSRPVAITPTVKVTSLPNVTATRTVAPTGTASQQSAPFVSATPTMPIQVLGAVEAENATRSHLGYGWLLLAAVVGTGLVGGGVWLWKRA